MRVYKLEPQNLREGGAEKYWLMSFGTNIIRRKRKSENMKEKRRNRKQNGKNKDKRVNKCKRDKLKLKKCA
jgi:hypothetical protein